MVDEWATDNPWRILCEIYAKLSGLVMQHWFCLVSFWAHVDRSLVKAAATVRDHVSMLAAALKGVIEIDIAIEQLTNCLHAGCSMNPRKKKPNAYQLLLHPTLGY